MATNLLLTPELQLQAFERRLLDRFRTTTIFNRWGWQKSIPAGQGVAVNWRRMEVIRPVVTASTSTWPADATYTSASGARLTEGTFHTPSVIASWASVTATVQQFGQAAYVSEINMAQGIDPQEAEYIENFSESMTDLLDLVTRDVLLGATNLQYANGRASASAVISGDFLNLTELRKAKRTLKRANAEPVEDGKYVVLVHPDTSYDLEGDTNIITPWQYGGAGNGSMNRNQLFDVTFKDLPLGFRLYESSIVPISRASGYGDVYNSWVIGRQYYGTAKLSALPARVIRHMPGTSGVTDPLDQVGTIGWKANWAAVILAQNNGVLIKHQTSAYTGTRAGL